MTKEFSHPLRPEVKRMRILQGCAQVAKIAKKAGNVARFAFRNTELRILPRGLEAI
jgi:hypothetical protein